MTDQNPLRQLREPFTAKQTGKLPKVTCSVCSDPKKECTKHERRSCRTCRAYVSTQHIHVDFVGHAHITERLLNVDPLWFWEPLALGNSGLPALDDNGGLWIKLHVAGMSRIGYGHANGKGGDAVKETIGDALRNAAMRFGVALGCWMKETPAPIEETRPRETERPSQTSEERATELRKQIAVVGKGQGKTIDLIAGEFAQWTKGTYEITNASVAVLAEYLDHLQRGAA